MCLKYGYFGQYFCVEKSDFEKDVIYTQLV